MALCDYLITNDIAGYDCDNPMSKGVGRIGLLLNRADINFDTASGQFDTYPFRVNLDNEYSLKCDKQAYKIMQTGRNPFNGTQQEMVEGATVNTITNTLQFVVLRQDADFAKQLNALVNGEFVAVLANNNGTFQVYGYETGLHCTGAVRELYSDDNLAGWLLTFTEEGAVKGNLFCTSSAFFDLVSGTTGMCE